MKNPLKRTFVGELNQENTAPSTTLRPPPAPPLLQLLSFGKTLNKPLPPPQRSINENDVDGLPSLPPQPSFHTKVLEQTDEDDEFDVIDGGEIQLNFTSTLRLDQEKIENSDENNDGDDDVLDIIEWVYVDDGKESAYYWNMITNETTYDQPSDFDGLVYSEDVLRAFQKQYQEIMGKDINSGESSVGNAILPNVSEMWQVGLDDEENYYYYNMQTEETTYDRPGGTLFISCIDENKQECHWQESYDEEGNPYYYNMWSGESQWDMPTGTMYIILSAQ